MNISELFPEFGIMAIMVALLPFCAFIINFFIPARFEKLISSLSSLTIFSSALISSYLFVSFFPQGNRVFWFKDWAWFSLLDANAHPLSLPMGIFLDSMSVTLLLMVTWASFAIHIFSTYYMKGEERYSRFFVYLSLFTAAMLGLVISSNLFSVFIFWELMGFCSYSLIGFYYEKEGAGNASLKAFMTTRVGDVFFLLAIVALWNQLGSTNFLDLTQAVSLNTLSQQTLLGVPFLTLVGFFLFLGTVGKSAQVPLQIWLPDAMWGPTPCSALIHAATMVAAGVYLALRVFPILEAGNLLLLIAYIGSITAFLAATMALIQKDLKAVLAFSTISQLGYMVLGVGVSAYNASFMHLITHAIFKACLFLGAGAVIHSIHTQDMMNMGGLRKKLPFTFFAFVCCTAAISGIPFFSGFVSKDRILGEALFLAWNDGYFWPPVLLGNLTAFLTAFYMARLLALTFLGNPRDQKLYDHTHQEHLKWNKNIPLLALSLFTLGVFFSGSLTGQGIVKIFPEPAYEWFQNFIRPPLSTKVEQLYGAQHELHHHLHVVGAIISALLAFLGVGVSLAIYSRKTQFFSSRFKFLEIVIEILKNRYWFDYFYEKIFIQKMLLPLNNFAAKMDLEFYDKYVIDGQAKTALSLSSLSQKIDEQGVDSVVDFSAVSVKFFSAILKTLQNGKIQIYLLLSFILAGILWKIVL